MNHPNSVADLQARVGSSSADLPTFMLSLDTELIWGSFQRMPVGRFEALYPDVRGTIRKILALLDRYEVEATWAVVGHLFLDHCDRDASGVAHPELLHPAQSWWRKDWYTNDPCSDRERAPSWYGQDLLDTIQGARIDHEIGCHSFAHPIFGDPEMSREAAAADLDACIAVAKERGIELRSFVFPNNIEGHHDLLEERGFRAFRGTGPEELRVRNLPASLRRPVRLATQILASEPLVGRPAERLPGLWDLPATMLLATRQGLRKLSSRTARMRRVRTGIVAARRTNSLFHLWTHPWNLADDPDFHLGLLEEILVGVARDRDAGLLRVETMGGMAARLSAESVVPPLSISGPRKQSVD